MLGDKHNRYQLSYITIQENNTYTRNWYEYRKTVVIQGISTNTKNGTDAGEQYKYKKMVMI